MKSVSDMNIKLSQPQLDVTNKTENLKDVEGQFGDHQVKASSGWGLFGRIVLGVVTLGISELVRWAISNGDAPPDANKANQVLGQQQDIPQPPLQLQGSQQDISKSPLQQKSSPPVKQPPQWEGPKPHELGKPVENITQDEMKEAYGLRGTELIAIGEYTAKGGSGFPDYKSINTFLRTEGKETEMGRSKFDFSSPNNSNGKLLTRHIGHMQNGLSKLPDFQGTVYRGARLNQEQIAQYKVGMIITEPAFSSASRSEQVAEGYGGAQFQIESKHGKSIEGMSSFKTEQEVLFKAGTQFRVVANDGYNIQLEEV